MNSQSIYKIFFLHFFLVSVYFLHAQKNISGAASADKKNIVIGEQIHLTLQASFPAHEPISFFNIDSIPHFEILDRKKIDTVDKGEEIKLSQNITLTSFDSGHWVIPSFELPADKRLLTDTIPVDVGFSPFDPNKDYHDIKDIINVQPEEKKKNNIYWFIGASVLLVAVMIYLLSRKKEKPVIKGPPIDPYAEAKQDLEKLRRENAPAKIFYTRLVDIFRLYISRRRGIASLQKTTDDLVLQLRPLNLPADDFNQLAQALRMSDFVKFAKYEPTEKDKEDSFNTIKSLVDTIEKQQQPQ